MITYSAELLKLAQDIGITSVAGASYSPAYCKMDYGASEQDRITVNAICVGFEQASIEITDTTLTATCDVTDTTIVFSIWDNDGILQLQKNEIATNGVAIYTPVIAPGAYKIRVYGTISHMSNFAEMVVE